MNVLSFLGANVVKCKTRIFVSSVNSRAVEEFTRWAASCSESSAAFNGGEGVAGVMVKKTDPADVTDVSFAYMSPGDSVSVGAILFLSSCFRLKPKG